MLVTARWSGNCASPCRLTQLVQIDDLQVGFMPD